jgi:hypothetical protein
MMKKYIIALMLICISACDPIEWAVGHCGRFYFKNLTDRTLEIDCPYVTVMESTTIAPGDSIIIFTSGRPLGSNETPQFEDLHKLKWVSVHDAEGNELVDWAIDYTDANKRIMYKKDRWQHYKELIRDPRYLFIWVFNITNEDLEYQTE